MFAGGIGAPEVCPSGGLLYFWFSVYSIQCPHCVIKSSSSISLRNARSLTVSLGICLLSHWSHIYKQGGLRSLLSLRPSIPFKLDPALRLVTLFAHLKTRWLRALFGRNPGWEPSLIDSFHQVIASNQLLSLGVVSKGEFLSFLAQKKSGFILIGERLSRGKVLHIGPAALSRLPLVRLAPFFRLGSVPGLRPLGFSFSRRQSTCQPFLSH